MLSSQVRGQVPRPVSGVRGPPVHAQNKHGGGKTSRKESKRTCLMTWQHDTHAMITHLLETCIIRLNLSRYPKHRANRWNANFNFFAQAHKYVSVSTWSLQMRASKSVQKSLNCTQTSVQCQICVPAARYTRNYTNCILEYVRILGLFKVNACKKKKQFQVQVTHKTCFYTARISSFIIVCFIALRPACNSAKKAIYFMSYHDEGSNIVLEWRGTWELLNISSTKFKRVSSYNAKFTVSHLPINFQYKAPAGPPKFYTLRKVS
jgi:hypothetical protein